MSTLLKPDLMAQVDLPKELEKYLWRADQGGVAPSAAVGTGDAELDARLTEKGWACGAVTELLMSGPGAGEMRLLGPALRQITCRREGAAYVALLSPPYLACACASSLGC